MPEKTSQRPTVHRRPERLAALVAVRLPGSEVDRSKFLAQLLPSRPTGRWARAAAGPARLPALLRFTAGRSALPTSSASSRPRGPAAPRRRRADRGPRRMAGERPPLPPRRLHGPAQSTRASRGGGAAGPDRVMVPPPLTDTVRTTSTTQRDVTRRIAFAAKHDLALPITGPFGETVGYTV
jgi:hypothetical protein